jgi:hypothetical protein
MPRQLKCELYVWHATTNVGTGYGCRMLKFMAVFIVSAVALLLQGTSVWAHDSEVGRSIDAFCCDRITKAETVPIGQDDCWRGDCCCMTVCCPCQSGSGAHFTMVERMTLQSSPIRLPNGDFVRSVVLARDPPIPIIRHFQAL